MPDESRPDFFLCDIPQEATLNAEMVLAAADTLRKPIFIPAKSSIRSRSLKAW